MVSRIEESKSQRGWEVIFSQEYLKVLTCLIHKKNKHKKWNKERCGCL